MKPRAQAKGAKISQWDYIKVKMLLHITRSNQDQNVTCGMGENICRPYI